jgi:four helix bundle protein
MESQKGIRSVKDLKVYNLAFRLSMLIFECSKRFPKEETYSLTDQIRRSSRSVTSNIREGYAKRKYQKVFIAHLVDALGSSEESRVWLEYANACQYISSKEFNELDTQYGELSAMLNSLSEKWQTYK